MYFFKHNCYLSVLGYVGSGLLCGSDGKESACQFRRHRFNPWVGKILWSREWKPALVFLSGESMNRGGWQGLRSMELQGVDTAEQLTLPPWRWVFSAAQTFSICAEWRLLSSCDVRASHRGGCSCCRAWALRRIGLSTCGSVLELSSCSTWA